MQEDNDFSEIDAIIEKGAEQHASATGMQPGAALVAIGLRHIDAIMDFDVPTGRKMVKTRIQLNAALRGDNKAAITKAINDHQNATMAFYNAVTAKARSGKA